MVSLVIRNTSLSSDRQYSCHSFETAFKLSLFCSLALLILTRIITSSLELNFVICVPNNVYKILNYMVCTRRLYAGQRKCQKVN